MVARPSAVEVVEKSKQSDGIFNSLPGLADSPAFLRTIERYMLLFVDVEAFARLPAKEYERQRVPISARLEFPAWTDNPLAWLDIETKCARSRPDYIRDEAASWAASLATHLFKLRLRVESAEMGQVDISFERKLERKQEDGGIVGTGGTVAGDTSSC